MNSVEEIKAKFEAYIGLDRIESTRKEANGEAMSGHREWIHNDFLVR